MPRRSTRPTPHLQAYNIVRCLNCNFIQGIRKQAACKSCGKKLDASRLQLLGSTNKATELPGLVQRVKESFALK